MNRANTAVLDFDVENQVNGSISVYVFLRK